MATIEEVVEMWDKINPNNQTETLKGKNVQSGGKIDSGSMHGRLDKWAVIKLADGYPFAKWNERICYVFDFKSGKPEINFQRRSGYPCDTEKLYDFLEDRFINEKINGKKLTLDRGRNPDNLILRINFDKDSSAKEICDCMEEFIKKTQEKICDFLENKSKEEPPAESEEKLSTESKKEPLMESEGIFSEIMDKYKIKEDDKLYGKCEKIYNQTKDILKILSVELKEGDELKVSHYTKKSTARKLLIAPTGEKKCNEFRLYSTYGMNDPSEGKTLLSFLGIKNEDLKLPEALPFIACFSFEVNSLNQFRLYGNEDNKEANGVSIVFKPSFFNNEDIKLYSCVYIDPDEGKIKSISFSKEEKTDDFEKLFIKLKKDIQELLDIQDLSNIDKTELAKDLLVKINYLVKDYAFMEERECRIINMIDKTDPIYMEGDSLYVSIGEIKKYVEEIYFAPCTEGMEVFQIETGIECKRSRHPYKSKRP
jgi:hypothetical protein